MSFDDFLAHSSIEHTVSEMLKELHPILLELTESEDASPWETATALMVLLAGVSVGANLDKNIMMNLLSFLVDQTMEHPMLTEDFSNPTSLTKH
tara:strand:- start:2209 stop:2490 length:282 start_codon:yes stop_codon:yes gene_type:complete